eukprot:CAMPEP_0180484228 /NCGR_PEP_ID=MMETSP1036_2-20121128/35835_1 /TAXON_ID=632150 /ORGANISM="Azadinium spinosum, Strain 3D9" /LENGTH=118 /DNA_ID=CAMNT_0022492071 /DNA_START=454 /DNA_END=806 /DNA_ORIENTATION=+
MSQGHVRPCFACRCDEHLHTCRLKHCLVAGVAGCELALKCLESWKHPVKELRGAAESGRPASPAPGLEEHHFGARPPSMGAEEATQCLHGDLALVHVEAVGHTAKAGLLLKDEVVIVP